MKPLPSRVADLESFHSPTTRLGVQRNLGMLNYYRRFVPQLAKDLAPLQRALAVQGQEDTGVRVRLRLL